MYFIPLKNLESNTKLYYVILNKIYYYNLVNTNVRIYKKLIKTHQQSTTFGFFLLLDFKYIVGLKE